MGSSTRRGGGQKLCYVPRKPRENKRFRYIFFLPLLFSGKGSKESEAGGGGSLVIATTRSLSEGGVGIGGGRGLWGLHSRTRIAVAVSRGLRVGSHSKCNFLLPSKSCNYRRELLHRFSRVPQTHSYRHSSLSNRSCPDIKINGFGSISLAFSPRSRQGHPKWPTKPFSSFLCQGKEQVRSS